MTQLKHLPLLYALVTIGVKTALLFFLIFIASSNLSASSLGSNKPDPIVGFLSNGLIAYSESASCSSNSRRRAAHSASDSTSLVRGNDVAMGLGCAVRSDVRFRPYSTSWNTSLCVSFRMRYREETYETLGPIEGDLALTMS
jgi:hypothetical protein